jgi:hypothetical protein
MMMGMRRMAIRLAHIVLIEVVFLVWIVINASLRCYALLGFEGDNARGHRRNIPGCFQGRKRRG